MKTLTTAALGLSLLIGSAIAATPKAGTSKTQSKSKKSSAKKSPAAQRAGKAPGAVK